MSEEQKGARAGFWVAVALVAALIGYPLSFGPACWISSRCELGRKLLSAAYRPIAAGIRIKGFQAGLPDAHSRAIAEGAEGGSLTMQPARDGLNLVNWYAMVGAADHWHWCYDIEHRPNRGFRQQWEWRKWPASD